MASPSRSIADDIEALPHWARVAFAAHCARAVLPLFRDAWPAAEPRWLAAVDAAIAFAERSAAKAVADSATQVVVNPAVSTAGAALRSIYGMPLDGPAPAGETGCYVASFAAKAAEWSARAALADPGESGEAALEAYGFVRQVADAAGDEEVLPSLAMDLALLTRAAARGGWSDRTPVPPEVFELLSGGVQTKPWWRFW